MKLNLKVSICAIFILCILILLSTKVMATSYYVSNTGNDKNIGSELLPKKTIQSTINNLKAGDTLFIRGGKYFERLNIGVSGNILNGYITITSYPNEKAIIDGSNFNLFRHLLYIKNCSYLKINGLEFTNNFGTSVVGVSIRDACNNIIISNNKIYNINCTDPTKDNSLDIQLLGTNPLVAMSNIQIINNEISNCNLGRSEALTVSGNVENFQILNNKIHDVGNIGIDIAGHYGVCSDPLLDQARNGIISGNLVYNCESINGGGHAAGIYVDGGKNITVEKNTVHHTQRGLQVGCEEFGKTSENIVVRSNLVYSNYKSGIGIGGANPKYNGKVISCQVYDNVSYKNDTLKLGIGELLIMYSDKVTVKNNKFYSNTNTMLGNYGVPTNYITNLTSNYNIWFTESDEVIFRIPIKYYSFSSYVLKSGNDRNSSFMFFDNPVPEQGGDTL